MSRRGGRGPWLVHGFRAPLPGPPDTAEAAQNPGFRGDAQDHFDFKYLSGLFKPRSGAEISQWPTRTAFSPLRRTARAPCWRALSCSPGAASGARPRQAASRRPGARGAANSRREPDGVGRKLSTDRAPSSWLADVQKAWVLRAARTEKPPSASPVVGKPRCVGRHADGGCPGPREREHMDASAASLRFRENASWCRGNTPLSDDSPPGSHLGETHSADPSPGRISPLRCHERGRLPLGRGGRPARRM